MKKRKLIKGIKHEQSSGNVFSDVGLPEKYLAKALLVAEIHRIIVQRKLTQEQAASVLGIDQPRVSALLRGKLNLFSMERVMELLARLGSVEIRIAPSQTPSFRVVFNQKTLHHASLLKGANLFHFRTQSTSFPTFDSPDVIWVMPEQSGADNISDGLLGSFGSIGYENATLIKECGKHMPEDSMKVVKRSQQGTASVVKETSVERTPVPSFQSVYVNNVQVKANYFDIKMLMGEVSNVSAEKVEVEDKVAVIMSPEHAASLHRLLGEQLELYRENFGEIRAEPSSKK